MLLGNVLGLVFPPITPLGLLSCAEASKVINVPSGIRTKPWFPPQPPEVSGQPLQPKLGSEYPPVTAPEVLMLVGWGHVGIAGIGVGGLSKETNVPSGLCTNA